jgi:hypothetical protein
VHDAITFERKGVPAAVICTEPFISSADAMAKLGGIPDYPYVVLAHPLGSLDDSGIRERASQAAPDVLRILLARA